MLDMQADKDNGRAFEQTSYGAGTTGDSERIELFTGGRFNHAMELLEIEPGMAPKLLKGECL